MHAVGSVSSQLGAPAVLWFAWMFSSTMDAPHTVRCHNVFHISQLLEYKDGGREQAPPPPLDFDDGEGGERLRIERVLTRRKAKQAAQL